MSAHDPAALWKAICFGGTRTANSPCCSCTDDPDRGGDRGHLCVREADVLVAGTVASTALNIALAWFLVPRQGAIGAALASVIAQACDTSVSLWLASKISKAGISPLAVLRVWEWLCARRSGDRNHVVCKRYSAYNVTRQAEPCCSCSRYGRLETLAAMKPWPWRSFSLFPKHQAVLKVRRSNSAGPV